LKLLELSKPVLVLDEHGIEFDLVEGRDYVASEELRSCSEGIGEEAVEATHPFFALHTGYDESLVRVVHPAGGYLVQTITVTRWVGVRPRDTVFCTVWPGWITGVSHGIIGPLAIGASIVLYEGGPDQPSWNRWWEIVERYAVTVMITTSSALRILSKRSSPEAFNLDTLKVVLVTGEPLEPQVWEWTYRRVGTGRSPLIDSRPEEASGRIPVINLYIQTELGTFATGETLNMVFTWLAPGSAGTPIPGFNVAVVDESGRDVVGKPGALVLKSPWPSTPLTGSRELAESWSRGYYDTHDLAVMVEDGHVYVVGRRDTVLKVSGFRLSPREVEEAVEALPGVSRAVVAAAPDAERFETPFVLVEGDVDPTEVRRAIRERVGPIADPRCVAVASRLPDVPRRELRARLKSHLYGVADELIEAILSGARVKCFR
jgi:acetyl-CoA synthetase